MGDDQLACSGTLVKQARAEHHGDDQRQLHHSTGHHPASYKSPRNLSNSWGVAQVFVARGSDWVTKLIVILAKLMRQRQPDHETEIIAKSSKNLLRSVFDFLGIPLA